MKKFVFTLQALYDVKLDLENQQKIKIKKVDAKLFKLFEELERMKNTFSKVKTKHAEEIKDTVQPNTLTQYDQYFQNLSAMITMQKEKIILAQKEKEKCVQEQIETRKEIKTLDKLREKQYEEYKLELKMEQEKEIGDLVSYKVAVTI